jgi:hypothetical protein
MKKIAFAILVLLTSILASCAPGAETAYINGTPVDPFVAAEMARRTEESAAEDRQFFNMQLTATQQNAIDMAQTPIAQMTQDMAAYQMAQLYADATSSASILTQSAAATQTAIFWTPTPSSTPTPNITATLQFAQVQATVTQINLNTQKKQIANNFWAVSLPMVLITALLGVAYSAITYSRQHRHKVHESGVAGDKPLIENVVSGEWIDMDANPNYSAGLHKSLLNQALEQYLIRKFGFVPEMPFITAERQDSVKRLDQLSDVQTRTTTAATRRIPKALLDMQGTKLLPGGEIDEPAQATPQLEASTLALPDWQFFVENWKGDSRPLGLGLKGLITAQAASSHLLISGKTGTGKTGYMLRTQTTASLAKGYQVVNLGFSDAGFGVFSGHPNYHSVKLDQASDIIYILAGVYAELKERKALIGGESIEWEHWPNGNPPRPFVDLLIDELGNIAEEIYSSEESARDGLNKTRSLWRWMSMIANEGRKVGIRFVAALQDPTAKSVDLRFRRNCTLVSFQQGDASQSTAFIGTSGAELLTVGHFMARIDELVIGGGFAPTDSEIVSYLSRHEASKAPAPKWIEGVVKSAPQIATADMHRIEVPESDKFLIPSDAVFPTISKVALEAEEIRVRDEEIVRRYLEKQSLAQIQREVFGDVNTGGINFQKIKTALATYRATTSDDATTSGNGKNTPELA